MSEAALAVQEQPLTHGDIIQRMLDIREERRALSTRDKELVEEWDLYQQLLIAQLDESGTDMTRSQVGTATITEEIVPLVEDWDTFLGYIHQEEAYHLLQRRPATAAYRELQNIGLEVPGVVPFKKRSISLRARNK
jgi:hypothetical protein